MEDLIRLPQPRRILDFYDMPIKIRAPKQSKKASLAPDKLTEEPSFSETGLIVASFAALRLEITELGFRKITKDSPATEEWLLEQLAPPIRPDQLRQIASSVGYRLYGLVWFRQKEALRRIYLLIPVYVEESDWTKDDLEVLFELDPVLVVSYNVDNGNLLLIKDYNLWRF